MGTRFFLGFALTLLRFWGKLFALALSRSFFGLKFRAFVLPRSSIFCTRTFALLDFHARNFVLVSLYTARTGQPGQDTQNRTGRTEQAEQNRQNRTDRTGQPEQDSKNRTSRTRLP